MALEQQLADGSKGSRIPVALMWVQQHYATRPPSRITRNDTITFQTVRGLRSAASSFHGLDMQTAFPGAIIQDRSQRVIAVRHCSPTDELSYTMMSQGMASRLGEDSNPSQELLAIHVRTLDASLQALFRAAVAPIHKLEITRAGWTNTNLFIAWLRGAEHFTLRHCDVERTSPINGPLKGLPEGTGCIEERLNPLTKASRTRTADVVIAYITSSGFGRAFCTIAYCTLVAWMTRLRLPASYQFAVTPTVRRGTPDTFALLIYGIRSMSHAYKANLVCKPSMFHTTPGEIVFFK